MIDDAYAVERGWPDADTMRRAVAIHEAGHALSFLLGGGGVDDVILRVDGT